MRDVIPMLSAARPAKPVDRQPESPQVTEFRRAQQARTATPPRR